MANMNFRCDKTSFNLSAVEFCQLFALVVDQNEKPANQISIRFLTDYKEFEAEEEFLLSRAELKSILGTLGIDITIPSKEEGDTSVGTVNILGNVDRSNVVQGSNNQTNHQCNDGASLTLFLTGNGIIVSNK